MFIAGELQTAVCLELVVVGLFYFVRSTFDCAHSSPGMISNIEVKNLWRSMSGFPIRGSDRVLIFHDYQLVFGLSGNHYQVSMCKTYSQTPI